MNHPSLASPTDRPSAWRFVTTTLGPVLALLCVVLFFAIADWAHVQFEWERRTFFTVNNLRTVSVQTATVAVAALGMTMIIIAGGIDLSAGTAVALAATVLAYFLKGGYSVSTAILAGISTGCLVGLINGALISLLRVVPFIVTLGTMTIFLGTAKIIANEITIRPPLDTIPLWLKKLVTTRPDPEWLVPNVMPNFATGVWLVLLLSILLAVVLRYTVFGRYVFALGSNESTARLCGINIPVVKTCVYTLAGLFVGIAGVYQFARLSVGNPTSGIGMELKVIAAVVIGGGSLNGGQGSVLGSLAGAAIMAVIASGCTSLGLSNPIQDVIIGVIIIAAVAIDQLRQRRLAA